ncbi:hypothetical protein Y032_0236g3228 [Ancylostoma ceylanicum]|uniref:Uncharacterized protein n=1 Tax=Ancylostoma ceylanicum TaxID=53326 RepID=A0A016SFF5_9BILA|nr:hypothetical protein Y032_0236g3228 [Ancylostoma ceylanicum]
MHNKINITVSVKGMSNDVMEQNMQPNNVREKTFVHTTPGVSEHVLELAVLRNRSEKPSTETRIVFAEVRLSANERKLVTSKTDNRSEIPDVWKKWQDEGAIECRSFVYDSIEKAFLY